MQYEEEINYRNKILSRVRSGERINSEDRQWLVTHRIVNRTLGYPYLNTDILHIQPNQNYSICVKLENLSYPGRIIPVITVPAGKGRIVTNSYVTDIQGNVSFKKPVKTLGVLVDATHPEAHFYYKSSLGLLGVGYQCEYFDECQRLFIRKSSDTGDPTYAMIAEPLTDSKMLYRCKSPIDNNFQSLEFSIEWKIEKD